MANPARKHTEPAALDPRTIDPINPVPPRETAESRFAAANDRVDNRGIIENQTRGVGSGAFIAIAVLVLAAIAYFLLAPATMETTAPEPPTAAAPEATAPVAPDAMAPAAPAPSATPVEPAPATPAPAAPAQ